MRIYCVLSHESEKSNSSAPIAFSVISTKELGLSRQGGHIHSKRQRGQNYCMKNYLLETQCHQLKLKIFPLLNLPAIAVGASSRLRHSSVSYDA